jgi:hypothetical protein
MTPPPALMRARRFGLRANQARAVPAVRAQTVSLARAIVKTFLTETTCLKSKNGCW